MPHPSPRHCPVCGVVLADDSPDGMCSRCLLQAAMLPTEPADHQRAESPSLAAVSAAFPQLEILELIGQGGMGAVFKARQPKLDRLVALKLLPASLAERDAAFAGRFEREGRLLARLHHPNIVAVHDSGTAGGFFYLLMEFVEGVNLRQAMRSRRFTSAQALAIIPHICDALQFAHEEGVLHRDIKPENILLDGKGRVKLADFGIAKLMGEGAAAEAPAAGGQDAVSSPRIEYTRSGATLGTPSYMAPEQRDTPGAVDHRADIYSLGVVFYELLTGELPTGSFEPPSAKSEADPRVDAIVAQALEKERTRRQSSAGEVKTQVETVVQKEGKARAGSTMKRKLAVAGVALVGFVVLAMGCLFLAERARAQARQAQLMAQTAAEQERAIAPASRMAEWQARQFSYEQAFAEWLDARLELELDASLSEPERKGEALAGKEKVLAEKVASLRAGIEAAPPPPLTFNDEIGSRR
ncbi:MAG TPA: serine/threonine-protein kinase [Chthoniobacteraceae bacterium]|nr:serine/threonine-protein kinase [Chthoniobacteraceae bacterium]